MEKQTEKDDALPLWNIDPVYAGFESERYRADKESFTKNTAELLRLTGDAAAMKRDAGAWLTAYIAQTNKTLDLYENLASYAYARFTTDTRDPRAQKELNALEEAALPLTDASVAFRNVLADLEKELPSLIERTPGLSDFAFFLTEELFLRKRQMSPQEENLAADLSRCGGDAWGRMQEAVSASLSVAWDEKTGERKTVTQLRALAYDRDREIRRKAYRLELEAWKSVEIPLSFSINGVKGFSVILNKRRNWEGTLERSARQARISMKALESMIEAMEESLPAFRTYLRAKAKLLGIERCSFYDIFAPTGDDPKVWSFEEARGFILEKFSDFSEELGAFGRHAFDNAWIDARPRDGKVGGAYCTAFPILGESRILCNFGGAFGDVSTIAHELGHGYHHHILKEACAIHRSYPMTLAETASIFNESIILQGALEKASGRDRIPILETFLQETTQVIVDILSRYYFEKKLCELREKSELSPDELSAMMLEAQKATYGDGLNEQELHPYMWAVKSHYYRPDLAFYNFPYAFGQLFGLGLYSLYRKDREAFIPRYRALLGETGKASAVDLARSAGFDIEGKEFWRQSLATIGEKIAEFRALAEREKG